MVVAKVGLKNFHSYCFFFFLLLFLFYISFTYYYFFFFCFNVIEDNSEEKSFCFHLKIKPPLQHTINGLVCPRIHPSYCGIWHRTFAVFFFFFRFSYFLFHFQFHSLFFCLLKLGYFFCCSLSLIVTYDIMCNCY